MAIASGMDTMSANFTAVLEALNKLQTGGGMQGWPANANSVAGLRVAVPVTGVRLPDMAVPSGMSILLKAWSLNPGWLQVGGSTAEATNVNQSFTLLPNETVGYQIENANQIYIAATAAGCFVVLTVEKKK
jgi:hypothetical protein